MTWLNWMFVSSPGRFTIKTRAGRGVFTQWNVFPRSLYFGDGGDKGGVIEGSWCEFEMLVIGTLTEVLLVGSWFDGIMTVETRVGVFADI